VLCHVAIKHEIVEGPFELGVSEAKQSFSILYRFEIIKDFRKLNWMLGKLYEKLHCSALVQRFSFSEQG